MPNLNVLFIGCMLYVTGKLERWMGDKNVKRAENVLAYPIDAFRVVSLSGQRTL